MKLFALITSLLLSGILSAQDTAIQRSKYEQFISQSGIMMFSETFDLSTTKEFSLKVYKATNLDSKASSKAVAISQMRSVIFAGGWTQKR